MQILKLPDEMRGLAERWRKRGLKIGFVPTMGALHAGHLSLVRESLRGCDRTVVGIFVNPIQFGPSEDFSRYPRPLAKDLSFLKRLRVDAVYLPTAGRVFPPGFATSVDVFGPLTEGLCGPRRPGHFKGVATIVAKLLNVVRPHAAFFGRKDAQQAAVIQRMVADLDFDVEVVVMPTVREPDGLAMSSRNRYLSPAERSVAPAIFRALMEARKAIEEGVSRPDCVRRRMRPILATKPPIRVEYTEFVDARTFEPLKKLRGDVLIAVAARLGRTRLIDNMTVRTALGGKSRSWKRH